MSRSGASALLGRLLSFSPTPSVVASSESTTTRSYSRKGKSRHAAASVSGGTSSRVRTLSVAVSVVRWPSGLRSVSISL